MVAKPVFEAQERKGLFIEEGAADMVIFISALHAANLTKVVIGVNNFALRASANAIYLLTPNRRRRNVGVADIAPARREGQC